MEKKKVLFVATVDSHIELFHVPYLKMFHDKGWEVHVATDTDKPIKYCDKKIKLPIKRSPFKIVSNFKAVRELRKIAKREGYEIVHCHTPMGGVVARLACKGCKRHGTRVMYTAHGFHFYTGAPLHFWLMFYPVEWYLAKYTDTLIAINNEDYERAKRKFGKRCRDIRYVPGVGVDEKKFAKKMSAKEKLALRKKLGLKEDDNVLICVGRLDKNKNQGFLIEAMKELATKDSNYHLLLVGPDEINGKYQKLANKLGVDKNVHFLGFRNDISELMQISDVAVSASKREGLPVNLIEAAMLGLPIVASDCRGNRDVCKECGGQVAKRESIDLYVKNISRAMKKDVKSKASDMFGAKSICIIMGEIYYRKKRVLHVLSSDRFSGAENVACMIIRNLSDEFDMAYCSLRGPIEEKLKEMNIKYYGIDSLSRKNLRDIILEYNPDIIHAHDFKASLEVIRFGDRIIVSHLHKNDPKMKKFSLKSILYCFAVPKFSKIMGVSDNVLDEYVFKNQVKQKYVTIPNYVDKNEILRKANAFKVDRKYDLFFFGRLSDEKNPLDFIKIVSALNNDKIKCLIVGDGPLFDVCSKQIKENGLSDNIDMVGFQSNPYPYIKASTIGIMPSKFEGFGLTAIESVVLGKPVINSGVGGLGNLFLNTNLIANGLSDYVHLIENNRYVLPDIDKYLDYDRWRSSLVNVYSVSGW